jgi:hypothetical protein
MSSKKNKNLTEKWQKKTRKKYPNRTIQKTTILDLADLIYIC